MLVQKALISIYDYEVSELEEPFYFRLEIHKVSGRFLGTVFRRERYRMLPTFPTSEDKKSERLMDDALIFVQDEFIDSRELIGSSENEVISLFLKKIAQIFDLTPSNS